VTCLRVLFPTFHPPTPAAHIPVSNSKCSEHSKSIFTPVGSSGHSNLSRPPCHLNTREYPNVMQYLRCLASFLGSRDELASLYYNKIPYHKMRSIIFLTRSVLCMFRNGPTSNLAKSNVAENPTAKAPTEGAPQ
jgi:hypothetical protein